MTIFQNKRRLFNKSKPIGYITFNDPIIIKNLCFLWVADFRGLTEDSARLPTLFGFSLSSVSKPIRVFHPRENLALLAITHHKFFRVMQLHDSVGRRPTVSSPPINSPSMVNDHNHALTPSQCDVLVHMKCNMPLHVNLMLHV